MRNSKVLFAVYFNIKKQQQRSVALERLKHEREKENEKKNNKQ